MKSITRKLMYVIPTASLLVFIVYYQTFLGPILNKTGLNIRELSSLQETAATIQTRRQEIKDVGDDIRQLESMLMDKKQELPENLDSHDMIYLLSQAGADRLKRQSLIFLEPISQEDYKVSSVRFSFMTNYMGLMDFLIGLSGLPNKPTLSNMQVLAGSTGSNLEIPIEIQDRTEYDLDIEVTLNFYMRGTVEE